ncbi:MAG: hypothetical protein HS117_14200 [Verrucomicrobiaceae bacterium]|jgi:sensor domain CHASE-containing protein|nr:hypothetical protein [Verrucomicrobiaceae bacterium]
MEVFAVTIFVSLMFAVLFAALFLAERTQKRRGSLEQVALLPLDDCGRVSSPISTETHSHDQHLRHQSPR